MDRVADVKRLFRADSGTAQEFQQRLRIRFVPGCLIDDHDQFRLKIVSQRKGGLQFVPDFRRDDSQPHAVVPQLP